MREDKLYNISGSTTTITFSVVAACLLSLVAYFFYEPQVSGTEGLLSFLFNRIHTEHIRIIINLGAILISSLLLLWINNIYTIVRAHSSLPLLFFLLLECSNPDDFRITNRQYSRTGDLIVHSTSLQYISKYSPAESAFTFSLLITAGFLFWTPLISFSPENNLGLDYIRPGH